MMKYDFETLNDDQRGRIKGSTRSLRYDKDISLSPRFSVTKVDSMRKIIQHIDARNWRTLDYFRMLEKRQIARVENSYRDYPISVRAVHRCPYLIISFCSEISFGPPTEFVHRKLSSTFNRSICSSVHLQVRSIHFRQLDRTFFSRRNLTELINQQRVRDRSQKLRQEQQEREIKKRNQKILQTVNQHFPDIDIVSRVEKHQEAIEQLAKPRSYK